MRRERGVAVVHEAISKTNVNGSIKTQKDTDRGATLNLKSFQSCDFIASSPGYSYRVLSHLELCPGFQLSSDFATLYLFILASQALGVMDRPSALAEVFG